MNNLIKSFELFLTGFQSIALLCLRLLLAYGFFTPALKKITHFPNIVSWFANSLHLPFPYLNAVLATTTEALGVILLILGFKTRLISIPLAIVMLVAISTVHLKNGFATSNNGFEIPLYYLIMLLVLMTVGPGKYSLDKG